MANETITVDIVTNDKYSDGLDRFKKKVLNAVSAIDRLAEREKAAADKRAKYYDNNEKIFSVFGKGIPVLENYGRRQKELNEAFDALSGNFPKLHKGFLALSGGSQKSLVNILNMSAVVTAVAIPAFEGLVLVLGGIVTAIGAVISFIAAIVAALATVVVAIGALAAAAVVGFGVFTKKLFDATEAAGELIKNTERMKQLSKTGLIDKDATNGLEVFNEKMDKLAAMTDIIAISFGETLAPLFNIVLDYLIDGAAYVYAFSEGFRTLTESITLADIGFDTVITFLRDTIGLSKDTISYILQTTASFTGLSVGMTAAGHKGKSVGEGLVNIFAHTAKSSIRIFKYMTDAVIDMFSQLSLESLWDLVMGNKSLSDMYTDVANIASKAYNSIASEASNLLSNVVTDITETDFAGAVAKAYADAVKALDAARKGIKGFTIPPEEKPKKPEKDKKEGVTIYTGNRDALKDKRSFLGDLSIPDTKAEDAATTTQMAFEDAATAFADTTVSMTNDLMSFIDNVNARALEKNGKLTKKQKDLAIAMFIFNKQAAIAQAAVNTGVAVTKAMEAGPGIGFVLAGLTAAAGVAEIAKIAATPIPEYATGAFIKANTPDHMAVGIQPEESILNKQATRALGGEQGINELNRNPSAALGSPAVIVVQLDGKELDRHFIKNINDPSSGINRSLSKRYASR